MTWALVTMICVRFCQPQYVELYPSKEACMSAVKADGSRKDYHCVPAVQVKDKTQ